MCQVSCVLPLLFVSSSVYMLQWEVVSAVIYSLARVFVVYTQMMLLLNATTHLRSLVPVLAYAVVMFQLERALK